MRMTYCNSCCISSIIRPGHCWQVEQLAYHKAELFFASSSIASDSQLDLTGRVLRNGQPASHQGEERNSASLCQSQDSILIHVRRDAPAAASCSFQRSALQPTTRSQSNSENSARPAATAMRGNSCCASGGKRKSIQPTPS